MKLINAGGGKLNARASSSDGRIEARLAGDLLEIDLQTSRQGKISGTVVIESDGGTVSLPVTGKVEVGPVIEVEPRRVDFGRVLAGARPSQTVSIRNAGGGKLKWDLETRGDFFTIELTTSGFTIYLGDDEGMHRGSIFISSNGGKVTVDVEATVESEPVTASPPIQFRPAEAFSIAGAWAIPGIGAFVFAGRDAAYQYTEYNLFGQPCGQGTAVLQGNVVQLNGMNVMAGPIAGSFAVNGNLMSRTLRGMFGQMPLTLTRA